jgi:hypothetical protein
MAGADRLSALPNDVLQRILSFVPAREAVASSILSRRYRSLWRQTSAIILDSQLYEEEERKICRYSSPTFDAFFRDSHAALAAFRRRRGGSRRRRGGSGLKRLTLSLRKGTYYLGKRSYNEPEPKQDSRVADLLDDPAVARLEELSISAEYIYDRRYAPPLDSLSCAATLRVLALTRCSLEHLSPGGLSFPHLTDLTLRNCYFLEGYLQVMVDAAPALAILAVVNINQRAPEPAGSTKKYIYDSDYSMLPLRLRCPTVTALAVVASPNYVDKKEVKESSNGGSGIELDMPRLGFFRYYGFPIKISLTSPTPGLARVHLDVTPRHQHDWGLKYERTSRMLASFSSTRALKLRINLIEDLVEDDEEHAGVMLTAFPNLKLLELDAKYEYMNSNTAVATAMLLRSCPAMTELRLRLNMRWDSYHNQKYKKHVGGSFGEAMERFESLGPMSSARRDAVQISGISELPDALTNNCAFSCLQNSLRKVRLQFKAKELNCFQVQLAKFLVENAMVLEEMHVDDGSRFWPDRLFHKVARWRADAFRRRNLQPDTAAGFRVYQLDSPVVDPKEKESFYSFD